MASASVSRSMATASRPRPCPIIVSWTSSAWRCLSRAPISTFLRRLRRPNLDAAWQAARGMAEQIDDDFGDVVRRQLPVGGGGLMTTEAGVHRARSEEHTSELQSRFGI